MGSGVGKIGRLGHDVREQINLMILDNRPATEILDYMHDHGVTEEVSPQNISAWKKHGWAKWMRRRQMVQDMQDRREFAQRMVSEAREGGDADLTAAGDAASAMATDMIMETLEEFDPTNLKVLLAENPKRIFDLFKSLQLIRHRDQTAKVLEMKVQIFERQRRELCDLAEEQGQVTKADIDQIMKESYGLE